jgi:hypothetical protein
MTQFTPETLADACGTMAPAITSVNVGCTPTTFVYEAETSGWTGLARLNMWTVLEMQQGTNEEHTLQVIEFTEDCTYDLLQRELESSRPESLYEPDFTTTYDCDDSKKPPEKPDDRPNMTYALRIYDTSLELTDCVMWGADVEEVLLDPTGGSASNVPHTQPIHDFTELYSCRESSDVSGSTPTTTSTTPTSTSTTGS